MPGTNRHVTTTKAWRTLRDQVAHHLANVGPLPCSRCQQPVTATDTWDLDHLQPLSQGGDPLNPANTWPAHAHCNRSHGARIGNHQRQHTTTALTPSRDW